MPTHTIAVGKCLVGSC